MSQQIFYLVIMRNYIVIMKNFCVLTINFLKTEKIFSRNYEIFSSNVSIPSNIKTVEYITKEMNVVLQNSVIINNLLGENIPTRLLSDVQRSFV